MNFKSGILPLFINSPIHLALRVHHILISRYKGAVPSFISPNPAGETISMPETTPLGTQIYTIDANDNDDHTGASIAYLLENQDPTDRFTLNGKVLETNSLFDYESEPTSYQLIFR